MKVLISILLLSILATSVTTDACSPENPGCLSCTAANAASCNRCAAGYRLSITAGVGSCVMCPFGTGRAADIFDRTVRTYCTTTCDPGCNLCGASGSECLACKEGYRYNAAGKYCQACLPNTGRQADTTVQTTDTTCDVTCDATCRFCGATATTCVGCHDGFLINFAARTCGLPLEGKGKGPDQYPLTSQNNWDTDCSYPDQVLFCSNNRDIAFGCRAGFSYNLPFRTCSECPEGFTRPADTTKQLATTTCDVACSRGCLRCIGTATYCDKCKAGHFWDAGSFSCMVCPAGRGSAEMTDVSIYSTECNYVCQEANCYACDADGVCLGCKAGYKFNAETRKCTLCEDGKGRGDDSDILPLTNTVCNIDCADNCKFCGSAPDQCLGCKQGFRFDFTGKRCIACGTGYSNPADTLPRLADTFCSTQTCLPGCSSCNSVNECLQCAAGYKTVFVGQTRTCLACSGGRGIAQESTSNAENSECSVECKIGCETCSQDFEFCISCAAGYYMSTRGTCSLCPIGKGKLRDLYPTFEYPIGESACNIVCADGCGNCRGTTRGECLNCDGDFFFNGINSCTHCNVAGSTKNPDEDTFKVATPSSKCDATCHTDCRACRRSGSSSNCSRCKAGYFTVGIGSCQQCSVSGKGKAADSTDMTRNNPKPESELCTVNCASGCGTCSGPEASDCTSCLPGYYNDGACILCGLRSGTEGGSGGSCSVTCNAECETCTGNAAQCLKCSAGHYADTTSTCTACLPGFGKAKDSGLITAIGGSQDCSVPCNAQCRTCGGDADECVSCSAGYYYAGDGVCTKCDSGKGKAASAAFPSTSDPQSCVTCATGCDLCSGTAATDCLRCKAGFYMSASAGCQQCADGTGKAADTANVDPATAGGATQCNVPRCADNCHLCAGAHPAQCLMCHQGYFLSSSGCEICNAGTGKPADTTIQTATTSNSACTVDCSIGCSLCSSTSETDCLRCGDGFYYSATGRCSRCPANTGRAGDSSPPTVVAEADVTSVCAVRCPEGCLNCNAIAQCPMCDKGHYKDGRTYCSPCNTGTGKPADTEILTFQSPDSCSACHASCALCYGPAANQCLMCNAGFYKSGTDSCTRCPAGSTKVADATVTAVVSDPTTVCTVPCATNSYCYNCNPDNQAECFNCPEGRFLSTNKVCYQCANGKTKDADSDAILDITTEVATCTTACGVRCLACLPGDLNYCLRCANNFFFTAAGQCSRCNDGRGFVSDSDPFREPLVEAVRCSDCSQLPDYNCLGCLNDNTARRRCNRCYGGDYLSSGDEDFGRGSCVRCPANTGRIADVDEVPMSTTFGVAECTIPCHANCLSCSGPGENQCTRCHAGFRMSAVGTCTACPLHTGKAAHTVSQRSVEAVGSCFACHESCRTCSGPDYGQCLTCSAAFYYRGDGECGPCNYNRGKPEDLTIPIATTEPDACSNCHPKCSICKGPLADDCLACYHGHFWAGNGICTRCDTGTGKNQDDSIQTQLANSDACTTRNCHESCVICAAGNTPFHCMMCTDGYYANPEGPQCSMCPIGRGKLADAVFPPDLTLGAEGSCTIVCHPSCRTCRDSTAQGCLNCNAGFYMSAPGTCTLCDEGYGAEADTVLVKAAENKQLVCTGCYASCSHCIDGSSSGCLGCRSGFYLSNTNFCEPCPLGFGRPADTGVTELTAPFSPGTLECTAKCHPSCRMCKGPNANDCINCNDAYWWAGDGVCTACPAGTGKPHDGFTFQNSPLTAEEECYIGCDESCHNCKANGPTNCLSCAASFFHSAEGTCERCPVTKGKPADTAVVTPITTSDESCTTTCALECSICTGPSASDCVMCSAGHHMSAAGTCSICPVGRGKLADTSPPDVTIEVNDVCSAACDPVCRSCASSAPNTCVGCNQRFFLSDVGTCEWCPSGTSKAAPDAAVFTTLQTGDACTLKCHPSCQHCTGPGETECASCNAGFFRSGETACSTCPNGKGKAADRLIADQLPADAVATEEACNIFCDSCSSGCQTCSGDPFECITCVSDRFLTNDKTCGVCPDNCLSCTEGDKCDKCAKNFKVTTDGKGCTGDCTVENCILCAEDPAKCTKCSDPFVLKSATECIQDAGVVVNELSAVSVLDSPKLNLDIRSDKLELGFSPNESRNFTSVTVLDKLNGKTYSCAEISCTYSFVNDKLSMDFNPDFAIVRGKLTIERGAKTSTTAASISSQTNRRKMQTQADYPIIVDGISLMKNSPLNPLSFTLRVIVGILRLPLSLLVFWKYPYLAMMMDHMVTHLKIFSLLGHPYMAYVEVVFQSVSDSKVLPFNFDNPFEKWDSATLDCAGYPGIRNKNLHCSWLDNYGQNFIGLISVGLLVLILYYVSIRLARPGQSDSWLQRVYRGLSEEYGLKFMAAKLDGNHVEILLMTVIAYTTADGSSKSVIGIILSTLALIGFAALSLFVTQQNQRVYQSKLALASPAHKLTSELDPEIRLRVVRGGDSRPEQPDLQKEDSFPVRITKFVTSVSAEPQNNFAVYFFAARYIRALLLTIFVTNVRDSVEQVVLVVILESVYLVAVILFDTRGTPAERLFYTVMHAVLLVHLILRAAATSDNLSEKTVQSNLATGIVVLLLVYIFCHIVASLLVFGGIFLRKSQPPAAAPTTPAASNKVEFTEGQAFLPPQKENGAAGNQAASMQSNGPISFYDMNIPDEAKEEQAMEADVLPPTPEENSKPDNNRMELDQANRNNQGTHAGTQAGAFSQ